jgi:ribosomal protein S18 acetylase RimI-like enzyme
MDHGVRYEIEDPRHGLGDPDAEAVWQLLRAADGEFVPPLSARGSTVQPDLEPQPGAKDSETAEPEAGEGPARYFDELRGQHIILARERRTDRVVGFLSYREHHRLPEAAHSGDHLYVSTVIVDPAHRRQGVTRAMYQRLDAEAARSGQGIATRTWSGNTGHLRLLEHLGVREVLRLPDHRGPGVDTLYLARGARTTGDGE